ncbi:MAG: AraC-type DNA-binding protein [Firmicutes bacterium]|nr:AraC-type DNA-binding protein [Bacillota bacterium]
MDRNELDIFLRRLTPFEQALQQKKGNGIPKVLDYGSDVSNYMKKHPFYNKRDFIEPISNPETDINKKLEPSGEFVNFCCHPRFLKKTALHSHSFIEMIYVYSGQCRQVINDVPIIMNTGDTCIVDMNVQHVIESAGENDIIINCLLSTEYLENIVLARLAGNDLFTNFFIHAIYKSREYNNFMLFRSGRSDKLNKLMLDILCEGFDKAAICSDEIINCYMILILTELLHIYSDDSNLADNNVLRSFKLPDILRYIHTNCNDATLASTAEYFHFHPNYLSMMMKKITGRNFTNILHEAKLSKASVLLSNSELAVAEIANLVGYQNINFFYQIFKKSYGVTPAEFRKKSKAGLRQKDNNS